MMDIVNPVEQAEMMNSGELWVDCALSLTPKERKVMSRLIRSQDKMYGTYAENESIPLNNIV